MMIHTDL